MRIFNYCYTGFMFFCLTISISLSLKGLIARAIMIGSATGVLMFGFLPVCIVDNDTLQIAVIGPMSGKDREGGQVKFVLWQLTK